jgi:L-alanine-DL-glutamate epimerase-like enolase superfamily enzyme
MNTVHAETADVAPLRIRRVDAIAVSVPLVKAFVMGGGQRVDRSECLIVRIEASNGLTGWGEASAAPSMSGDTLPGMLHVVEHHLAPRLVGRNALDRGFLARTLSDVVLGNTGAKAACEIAIHDLAGRHLRVPVLELLGGRARHALQALSQLGNESVEADIAEAQKRRCEGYTLFKLKVGVKSIDEEVEGIYALRKVLGADVSICADANTAMTAPNARKFVAAAADAGVLFLEQPFRDTDLAATAALARTSPIPLCADESAQTLEQIVEWQQAGAIGGVALKTIKLGGLVPVLRAAVVSDMLGLSLNLASKTGESSIAAAALVHLGYAVPNLDWGINVTNQYLVADLCRPSMRLRNGSLECPAEPGLGVDVDESAIEQFRVRSSAR